jgi:hypothetical protein
MIYENQNIVLAQVRLRRTLGGHLGWIWRMSRRTESKVYSRDVSSRTAQERPIVAFKSAPNSGPALCLSRSIHFHTYFAFELIAHRPPLQLTSSSGSIVYSVGISCSISFSPDHVGFEVACG